MLYSHKCANVNAGSVIGNLAVGTIILIISKVVASIFASPIAGDAASLLLGPVATELKTEAKKMLRIPHIFHIIIVNTNIRTLH